MDLVAAWGLNDYGYTFARKSTTADGYEIVGVGHEGSKVLARTIGYPGALQFVGREVHFVDSEGWKAVTWSGEPVLKDGLPLGPRANQAAWCAWLEAGPICIGGYWGGSADLAKELTVVRAGKPPQPILAKGEFPILAYGAVSANGRVLAANLGARSAGAENPGKVVVAWFDDEGKLARTKEFPVMARKLAFDADGRLIAHIYPSDGAGNGSIAFVDLEAGTTSPVATQGIEGPFRFVMAPDRTTLYILTGKGVQEIGLDKPLTDP